jgi:shikimate dehydrogenase
MSGTDRYAVVGNPIAHSRSPEIHERFARQTKQRISYERIEIPLEAFEERALALREAGFRGLNVTVPFKVDAAKLSDELLPRARLAGAVNTLMFDGDTIIGDNTDGIGFVRDVRDRLKFEFGDSSVLVLGAGGAVRGVIGALLDVSPRWIAVANRTHQRAADIAEEFGVEAIQLDEIPAEHFDLIINGTSTGLKHDAPPIDPETFNDCALAYDLVYAADPTPFMELARCGGAKAVSDGLGMLIEQAAESFLLWRGVRPDTAPVYRDLRELLGEAAPEGATVAR